MRFQVLNLDGGRTSLLPERCRWCGWWQGHDDGWPGEEAVEAWEADAGELIDFWGKLATGDGELLGFIQFGPAELYSRAGEIAGGEINDSFLLACSMVTGQGVDSIRKSLLMSTLAELNEQDVEQVDAFCASEGKDIDDCRLFSRGFLGDCGFYPVKDAGKLTMMRLELKGSQPSQLRERPGRRLLERIKRSSTAPSPATLCQR